MSECVSECVINNALLQPARLDAECWRCKAESQTQRERALLRIDCARLALSITPRTLEQLLLVPPPPN